MKNWPPSEEATVPSGLGDQRRDVMKAPDEVSAMLRLKGLRWGSKRTAEELVQRNRPLLFVAVEVRWAAARCIDVGVLGANARGIGYHGEAHHLAERYHGDGDRTSRTMIAQAHKHCTQSGQLQPSAEVRRTSDTSLDGVMVKRKQIQLYSAGCPTCRNAEAMIRRVAGNDHDLEVLNMHQSRVAAQADRLGVRSVPALVVDGQLWGGGVDELLLRRALA